MVQRKDRVDTPSLDYERQEEDREVVAAFMGNTRTLREARTKWLPQMKRESASDYNDRRALSYLYPMLRDTVGKTVARPFAREITLQGDVPDRLESIYENADGEGANLTQFGRRLLYDATTYGLSHVLTEFPETEEGETDQDQAAAGKSPFLTHVKARDLIAAPSEIGPDGRLRLREIRFTDTETEQVGNWSEREWSLIRVVRSDGTWETWRRPADQPRKMYVRVAEGTHTFPGIPLRTLYLDCTGWMMARPPFLDLAWINQAHFRAFSRQQWHEEFLRTPVFGRWGWTEEELEEEVALGVSKGVGSTNPEASAGWVESDGKAATVGREGLRKLEEYAEVLGHHHMVSRSGDVRATAVAVDEAKTETNVQAWIRAEELVLGQAYEDAATFVGAELPEEFGVSIFSDFPLEKWGRDDIEKLIKLVERSMLSKESALREVKRRGMLSDALDVIEELDRIESEGPALALISGGDGDAA
jgi:hypothetical protein